MSRFVDAEEQRARESGDDPRLAKLERLVADLHEDGIDFVVEGGKVSGARRERDRETMVDLGSRHIRLGIVADTHLGSRFEQLSALRAFYAYADERKVDAFVHAGDLVQGSDRMHKGMELEVHAHGADAQGLYAAEVYPRSKRKTYLIGGNHDDSFLKDGGVNIVRRVASQRDDLVYIGQDAAYLTLGDLRMYIVHPDGGGAYAKSYKPQRLAESLPPDRGVSLLLVGHYHVYGSFLQRHTHALMLPCFQAQYAWLARKALHPDIGGIVADIWLDDGGRIARFLTEIVSFPPVDEDWDHDASIRAGRGWSVGVSDGR